jgi:hypothetical protein
VNRRQWTTDDVDREMRAAIRGVAKAADCTITGGEVNYSTPVERAEASAAASRYRRLAAAATSPADADGYRELAKQALDAAGIGEDHQAKAAEYLRKARLAPDPRDRAGYEQLAAQERQKAGIA